METNDEQPKKGGISGFSYNLQEGQATGKRSYLQGTTNTVAALRQDRRSGSILPPPPSPQTSTSGVNGLKRDPTETPWSLRVLCNPHFRPFFGKPTKARGKNPTVLERNRPRATSFPSCTFPHSPAGVVSHPSASSERRHMRLRQILGRSRLLRENGRFLTHQGFLMRKHHFNDPESGFFRKTKRKVQPRNPLTDPIIVMEMMKGNIVNVLPMILVGGWINWAFSGFVATQVPFPLTLRFKPMLQRGINLPSLDPSWVSSASWYFLNVFGLRRVYSLVLGEETAAEQHQLLLQDQFLGPSVPTPPDPNKAFKAEWEALELVSHRWALQDVEEQLMSQDLELAGMFGPD